MTELRRNDPCHCGSGKKYKKCCMAKDETAEQEQAAQDFIAPLMKITEDEDFKKKMDEDYEKMLEYGDIEDELAKIFNDDYDLPELSDEESELVDDWWETYIKCEDAVAERQHLEGFIKAHPNLVIYLGLHTEVLFELGAGYLRLGKIDDHIEFMMRFRKEFPDVYIQSFGYYDSDIIGWLVSKNRSSEIPEYFNYFLDDPVAHVDQLYEVVKILNAKNLTDPLLQLVNEVYEAVSSFDSEMVGNEIIVPLLVSKFSAYLKPDFTQEDIEKLVDGLKEIKVEINPENFDASFWERTFRTIYKPYSKWEIPKPPAQQKVAELHFDMRVNFMRFLTEKTNISWVSAYYYAAMLGAYLFAWREKYKNKQNVLWDFSAKTMDKIISELSHDIWNFFDATLVAVMYNGIYYFADYLLECATIDQSQASAIQQDCIEAHERAHPKLVKQDIFALAFNKFPEWG